MAQTTTAFVQGATGGTNPGNLSADDGANATSTTTLAIPGPEIVGSTWNLLAEDAGVLSGTGIEIPAGAAILGVLVQWGDMGFSGTSPSATLTFNAGGTEFNQTGVTGNGTKTRGYGTRSSGTNYPGGNDFHGADLSTVAGQLAARAKLADGTLSQAFTGTGGGLGNGVTNCDYFRVTIDWVIYRDGTGGLFSRKASYSKPFDYASLVSHWRLDEASGTAVDAEGTVDGTYTGASIQTQKRSLVDDGRSVRLPAGTTGDYVSLGDNYDFSGTPAFTISAWVELFSGSTGNRSIITKAGVSGSRNGWIFFVTNGTNKLAYQRIVAGSVNGGESTTALTTDKIYHVAVTYGDGGANNIKLFINGVRESSVVVASSLPDTAFDLRIGNSQDTGSLTSFGGYIDELSIFNAALTETDIQDLYQGTDGGILTGSRATEVKKSSLISGAGIVSGLRRADLYRPSSSAGSIAVTGLGILSGARRADTKRTGTSSGTGILSGSRRADSSRFGALVGAGSLSGIRTAVVSKAGAVISAGVIAGSRKADVQKSGLVSSTGILSGVRRVDSKRLGTFSGTGILSGTRRADSLRLGALIGAGVISGVRRVDTKRLGALIGAGLVSGLRKVDVSKSGLVTGNGILSGVRRADARRSGAVIGTGVLSGLRRADSLRTAAVIGAGQLSGFRQAISSRFGALIGSGVFSASRQTDVSKTGFIEGTGILSGERRADVSRTGFLYGEGFLSGTRQSDLLRYGSVSGGTGSKVKGWGQVYAFGLSGVTYNYNGSAIEAGTTVNLFRVEAGVMTRLQTVVSDGVGYFAFTLTSDPFKYALVGHKDDGAGDLYHLVDTTDQELDAEVTLVQGPSVPTDD